MPNFAVIIPPKLQEVYPFTHIVGQYGCNQALGCHTLCVYNIVAAGNYKHLLPKYRKSDEWGSGANEKYFELMNKFTPDNFHAIALEVATTFARVIEHYSTIIASGNIGYQIGEQSPDIQFTTEKIVSVMVENLEWGCVAGPITSNHNYHAGDQPHLNQTWLLFSPKNMKTGLISSDPPSPINFQKYPANLLIDRHRSASTRGSMYSRRMRDNNPLFKKLVPESLIKQRS